MIEPPVPLVRPRVASGVLFLDDAARVLMVTLSYKDHLDIPGGMVEPGESPRAAARREVGEELGIQPPVGRLLVADWWIDSADQWGGAKLLFVFNGGQLTRHDRDRIAVDGNEVIGYRFHTVADLPGLTTARLANRLQHAVAAQLDATTVYLENGLPVTCPAVDE